jgi:hypothetical protein
MKWSGAAPCQCHSPGARLDAANALGDVQRLADRVGVPRVPRAWRKANHADANARRRFAAGEGVDPDVTNESICRALRGRLLRLNLHRLSLRDGPMNSNA